MSINIIITGANGRMGRTIFNLLSSNPDFNIANLVTRVEELQEVKAYSGKTAFSSLSEALENVSKPVIIDFSAPEASLDFARIAAKRGATHIIGTTGLNEEQRKELEELALKTPIFWSPNMSVGVNVLLKVLPELTKLLGEDYDVEVMEIHHKKKKDSPSGTAVRLGEALANAKGWDLKDTACYHREGIIGERPHKEIGLQTLRGGDVVGVHTIYFMGPGERIEITHHAHSRENFAQGAIRAAKWMSGQKPGKLYSINDMLGEGQ